MESYNLGYDGHDGRYAVLCVNADGRDFGQLLKQFPICHSEATLLLSMTR